MTLLWRSGDVTRWSEAEKLIHSGRALSDLATDEMIKALHDLKEIVEGDRRDVEHRSLSEPLRGWNIIVTGGMTWGDSPTEAFRVITTCDDIIVHDPDLGCYVPLMQFLRFSLV